MELTENDVKEIRECLELLQGINAIEYHNQNWLPNWAIKSPKQFAEEKAALLERALVVIGTSSKCLHT